jgi:hypothetical protein
VTWGPVVFCATPKFLLVLISLLLLRWFSAGSESQIVGATGILRLLQSLRAHNSISHLVIDIIAHPLGLMARGWLPFDE